MTARVRASSAAARPGARDGRTRALEWRTAEAGKPHTVSRPALAFRGLAPAWQPLARRAANPLTGSRPRTEGWCASSRTAPQRPLLRAGPSGEAVPVLVQAVPPLPTTMKTTSSTIWAPAPRPLLPRKQLPQGAAACRWMTWQALTPTPGAATAWGQGPPPGPRPTGTTLPRGQEGAAGRRGSGPGHVSPSVGERLGAAAAGEPTKWTTLKPTAARRRVTMARPRSGAVPRKQASRPTGGRRGEVSVESAPAVLAAAAAAWEAEGWLTTGTAAMVRAGAAWPGCRGTGGTKRRRRRRRRWGRRRLRSGSLLVDPRPPAAVLARAAGRPVAKAAPPPAWVAQAASPRRSRRRGRTACLLAQAAADCATRRRGGVLAAAAAAAGPMESR